MSYPLPAPYAMPQSSLPFRECRPKDWETYRMEISTLYVNQNKTVPQIRDLIRGKYRLEASEKQYKDHLKKWKLRKNITGKEWVAVARKKHERDKIGKASQIRVRDQPVSEAKLLRYIRDNHDLFNSDVAAADRNETAATPSDVDVYTPSEPVLASTCESLSLQTGVSSAINISNDKGRDAYSNPIDVETPDLYSASPEQISTPGALHFENYDTLMRDSSPDFDVESQPPPSPTLSISSILMGPNKFNGKGPAPMIKVLTLPRAFFDPINLFQDLYQNSLIDLMSSTEEASKWQLERTYLSFRYLHDEEDALQRELDLKTLESGEYDSDIERISLALADVFNTQGRYEAAERLIREVLSRYSAVDKQNANKLEAQSRLGGILMNQGSYQKAERIYRRVIPSQEQLLGPDNEQTLYSKRALAWAFYRQGKYKQAEELGKEVIGITTRVFGADHPRTLVSLGELALAYRYQGLWDEAVKLQTRVLEAGRKVWGEQHPNTLVVTTNLVGTYIRQGRLTDVEVLGAQVLEMQRKVLGEEHPNTLASMRMIARLYISQHRWEDAQKLQSEVLQLCRKVQGDEHPNTLGCMHNLAIIYDGQGRLKEAGEMLAQVFDMNKRVLGEQHPVTLNGMGALAWVYSKQGRSDDAKKLLEEALESVENILGKEHHQTLHTKHDLASVYRIQGRFTDAAKLEEEVLKARKRLSRK